MRIRAERDATGVRIVGVSEHGQVYLGHLMSSRNEQQFAEHIVAHWNAAEDARDSMEKALREGHGLAYAVPALRILRRALNGEPDDAE